MNWIQTHTNVFSAIVCHDGIFEMSSEYAESDELYSLEFPFGGFPWTSPLFDTFSAATSCQNENYTRTPQLTIHSSQDFCCTVDQGIQVFHTLQGKGIPSRFLHFPDENHWVLDPHNSQRWHQEVIAWLKNYV